MLRPEDGSVVCDRNSNVVFHKKHDRQKLCTTPRKTDSYKPFVFSPRSTCGYDMTGKGASDGWLQCVKCRARQLADK